MKAPRRVGRAPKHLNHAGPIGANWSDNLLCERAPGEG